MVDIESGKKQDTSSDASQEAPERARKDTPQEAKLQYEGSYPSVRLYKHSFSGFLATRPMSAGRMAAHPECAPYRSPRGKSVLPRRFEWLRLALVATLYQKIRPADGNFATRFLRRRPIRALSAGRSL